jgi:polar amino acid transport system substrate-binding protein
MAQWIPIASLALFALAGCAANDAHGAPAPLIIGFDIASPPLFDVKNGCPTGIYPLLVGAIVRDARQAMMAYPAPFSRVLVNLDSGEWGAGGILKTPARLEKYDFSDPIYAETIVVYFNKAKSRPINTMAELAGKRVGVVRGWSYGKELDALGARHYFVVEPANADVINFKKLQTGRIDALLTLKEVGVHLMSSGAFNELSPSAIPVQSSQTYIAFNKKSQHADVLLRLNSSINKLQASGQLSELVNQYLKRLQLTQASRAAVALPGSVADQLKKAGCPL